MKRKFREFRKRGKYRRGNYAVGNTAIGYQTLTFETSQGGNTAVGKHAIDDWTPEELEEIRKFDEGIKSTTLVAPPQKRSLLQRVLMFLGW